MDAISLLSGLKNKVLDAKNYDLLKRTYDLQNQNIEQLKTSNTAFKENNERLKDELKAAGAIFERFKLRSSSDTVYELTNRGKKLLVKFSLHLDQFPNIFPNPDDGLT